MLSHEETEVVSNTGHQDNISTTTTVASIAFLESRNVPFTYRENGRKREVKEMETERKRGTMCVRSGREEKRVCERKGNNFCVYERQVGDRNVCVSERKTRNIQSCPIGTWWVTETQRDMQSESNTERETQRK